MSRFFFSVWMLNGLHVSLHYNLSKKSFQKSRKCRVIQAFQDSRTKREKNVQNREFIRLESLCSKLMVKWDSQAASESLYISWIKFNFYTKKAPSIMKNIKKWYVHTCVFQIRKFRFSCLTLTRPLRRKLRISADSSLIRQKKGTCIV